MNSLQKILFPKWATMKVGEKPFKCRTYKVPGSSASVRHSSQVRFEVVLERNSLRSFRNQLGNASSFSSFCLSLSSPSCQTVLVQHRIAAERLGHAFPTFDYTSGRQSKTEVERSQLNSSMFTVHAIYLFLILAWK